MKTNDCYFYFATMITTGEIYLSWESIRAKITRPDVHAINGVIHVIDTVLMKKRDMTTSTAQTAYGQPLIIMSLSLILMLMTFKTNKYL